MAVSGRLRYEILRRDGYACRYCGGAAPDVHLTVDHVVPVALGGDDTPANLVAACRDCNAGKAATGPDEHVIADADLTAMRWSAAMKRAAEIQSQQLKSKERYAEAFDAAWCNWSYSDGQSTERPADWRNSAWQWHDAGLEIETLISLVDSVLGRPIPNYRMWRYFCGAVWRTLRDRQEIAQGLIEYSDPFDEGLE